MLIRESTIALAQIDTVLGDLKANVERHLALIERAVKDGANAIIFPELSLTGYTLRDINFDIARNPYTSKEFEPLLAASNDITIICGGVECDDRGAVYNSAFLFEEGELKHVHRKIYPPTYGIFEEMRYFNNGSTLKAFTSSRLGRIGILVCEDLWHPSLPYLLAHDDAQMIITIAASPTRLDTGDDAYHSTEPQNYTINREHHSAYSRLLSVYNVFVNRAGVEDGVNFWGGSEVVSPSGEVDTCCAFFAEDYKLARIQPRLVEQSRRMSRHFLDDRLELTRDLIEQRALQRKLRNIKK